MLSCDEQLNLFCTVTWRIHQRSIGLVLELMLAYIRLADKFWVVCAYVCVDVCVCVCVFMYLCKCMLVCILP